MRVIYTLFMLVPLQKIQAQVMLQPQLPSMGVYSKDQLWNLSVTNTTGTYDGATIEIVLTEKNSGQLVLSATSRPFLLPRGVKMLQLSEISPITYNATGSSYAVNGNPNGLLPVGVFTICYRLTAMLAGKEAGQLAEECETLEVEPSSPVALVAPFDRDSIESRRPFFSWLPPGPLNLMKSLSYDLKLVEIQPFQTEAEAVQQNIPVYQRFGLLNSNEPYPPSFRELDTAKQYAWQVIARSNGNAISASDIWVFNIRKPGPLVPSPQKGVYAKLSREEDGAVAVCNGKLQFEYQNEFNEQQVVVKLFDITQALRKELVLDSVNYAVQYGQNLLSLDMTEIRGIIQDHIYLLELTTPATGSKQYLKFLYRKPE